MAILAEEVASLRADIQQLKSDSEEAVPPPPLLASVTASDRKFNTPALAVIHLELSDKQRRQKNVVVRGLHPREDVDDCDLFLQLYEDHLECKPYIDRTKCRRLGKKTPPEGRSKPLFVVLESESSAQELIRKSYSLRAGYDDGFYCARLWHWPNFILGYEE